MKKIFVGLTLLILSLPSTAFGAELSLERKNLLRTSNNMQLTGEQQASFDKSLQKFLSDVRKALYKDYRASGKRREAKVSQAISLLYDELDVPMRKVLRDDQWTAFQYYKGALSELLLAEGYRL